jgi:hypothetical protein
MLETHSCDPVCFHHIWLMVFYNDLLQNILPELLKNVNLQTRIYLRSATLPPYNSCIPEQSVSGITCRTRWTDSKTCSFPWDVCLRRYLKFTIYATEVSDTQDLQLWIKRVFFELIHWTRQILQRNRQSVFRLETSYVEDQGDHFKRFL